ncbi:glycosyltransferase [Raoultella ornithinolytica]|uniref:Glycosyl transferase n=1 Tax=Raoultella ornithinolytica TaxID=54291 RepID=A0A855EWM6_RAOOR|nr:glycosyltransferase [Raoultella ornithinolytica]MCF6655163.1 glycosyltransferase [Raoultella ornithinolytica]MDS0887235.1 glycosyltransferase [Raoultella ornithinolytica]MEB6460037.1 glycosyltransferase [Raoultella ornithinolytica]PIK83009.1 glycosyl transferase [Raoultella ornithinolytica]QLJ45818.1 glycosyltransferase [Raoultella ornithinolytica]
MPIISVILPIYNIKEEYLEICIESVCHQTLDDIEIILVNDGSTNNCLEVCTKFSLSDNRIIVIDQPNSGVSVARNKGLEVARGEWIAFVDPDDWLEPEYLLSLYKSILSDTKIVICDCNVISNGEKRENKFLPPYSVGVINDKNLLLGQLVSKVLSGYYPQLIGPGVPWGKLFKHDFIKKHNLKFVPGMVRMQDNVFCLYAYYFADKIIYTGENKYNYRMENNSASFKYNKKIINHFEKYFEEVKCFIDTCMSGDERYKKALDAKILTSINSYLLYYFCHENYSIQSQTDSLANLMCREPYSGALTRVDLSYLTIQEKLFVILLKLKLYGVMKIIYKIKR